MVQRESLLAGAVPGKVPRGDAPPTSVSVEAIQDMSDILIFADINVGVSLTCQQWLICCHQWCLVATFCPEISTEGSQL